MDRSEEKSKKVKFSLPPIIWYVNAREERRGFWAEDAARFKMRVWDLERRLSLISAKNKLKENRLEDGKGG